MKKLYTLFRCLLLIAGLLPSAQASYGRGKPVNEKPVISTPAPLRAAPVITGQPTSLTACPGQPATFSVTATGSALTYQWRKNGTPLAGATTASYTITKADPADTGDYDVVVGSSSGPATSNPARLTVRPFTLIPTPPVGQTVAVGSPATFSVVATGDITSYQWTKNDVPIPGATNAIFTIPAVSATDAGSYTVRVLAPCGLQTPFPVNLVVTSSGGSTGSITITEHPTSQTGCSGGSITFRVLATGDNITSIRWRKNGTIIPGLASGAAYTLAPLTSADEGEYDVVLTNASGSVTSNKATLTVQSSAAITGHPTGQTVCAGSAATFSVVATGNIIGYQWRQDGSDIPGATSATYTIPTVSLTSAGQYDVRVITSCGPLISNPARLTFGSRLTVLVSPSSQTICAGSPFVLGAAIAGSNATGYQWRKNGTPIPGATGNTYTIPTATSSDAGEYDLVVSNFCGSSVSPPATVAVNSNLQLTPSATPVSCYQGTNGQAGVAVSGGSGSYTYRWSTGATTATINGLDAGTYSVVVTDGSGCSKDASVTVSQPEQLVLTTTTSPTRCFGGNDGAATVTATGGTGSYTYRWNTGGTAATITSLTAGSYSVQVTDANGCQQTGSVAVAQPARLVLTTASTAVKCFGGNDGTATVGASGGTAPYTYQWSTGATAAIVSGLTAGTYSVTVTDGNGCQQTTSVVVGQPASLLTLSTGSTATNCFQSRDGAATVTATGGGIPYTYLWSTGANTPTLNGLAAGTYSVQVTDNNGCVKTASVDVSQPPQLVFTTASTAVKCFGGNDGTASVTGSVGNYVYTWSTGATTATITSLTVGSYQVTVTDSNNCQQKASVEVTQPARLRFTLQKENIRCFGGSDGTIALSATGGTGSYQVLVNNNPTAFSADAQHTLTGLALGTYQLVITDANACQTPAQTALIEQPRQPVAVTLVKSTDPRGFGMTDGSIRVGIAGGTPWYQTNWNNSAGAGIGAGQSASDGAINELTQLGDGTYTLTVQDANYNLATQKEGCMATLTRKITQPPRLTLVLKTTQPVSCFGRKDAQLLATAEGGVPMSTTDKYTFTWQQQTGSTYTTLTDIGPAIQNLPAGNYRCIVTDQNDITQQTDLVLTEPARLIASASGVISNLCYNDQKGTATVQMQGGTSPYRVDWSNGASGTSLSSLKAGRYLAVVSDQHGCSAEVSVRIQEPAALAVSVLGRQNPSCDSRCDGSIQTAVKGGVLPYSLNWNNGQSGTALANLCGGNYMLTVRDANGCQVAAPPVELITPAAKTLTVSTDRTLCEGQTLQLDATQPGTNTYSWTFPAGSRSDKPQQTITQAGQYVVTVTDSVGCSARNTFTIRMTPMNNQLLFLMASQGIVNDTIVVVNVSSGSSQFDWLIPAAARVLTKTATGLTFICPQAGTYPVGLRGSNGTCEAEIYKTITIRASSGRRAAVVEPTAAAIVVYPNPTSGQFRVQVNFGIPTPARLSVIDLRAGQLVYTTKLEGQSTYDQTVNLPDLPAGTYLVQLATQTQQLTKRILVTR